jgi:hypothetical protein
MYSSFHVEFGVSSEFDFGAVIPRDDIQLCDPMDHCLSLATVARTCDVIDHSVTISSYGQICDSMFIVAHESCSRGFWPGWLTGLKDSDHWQSRIRYFM